MKALVKSKAEAGLWLTDVAVPTPGPHDLLVKVKHTAICGTDLHIYDWDDWAQKTVKVPTVIGHEFMGQVVEVGTEVDDIAVGDRIAGEGHITCGHCRNCRAGRRHFCRSTQGVGIHRDGCFAEYVTIPAANAFKLPEHIPDHIGAILDPLGNATHTALCFPLAGEDVLVTGAGPIGMMAVAICKHVGARQVVITDINDHRLELAQSFGATCTVNPKQELLSDAMGRLDMREGFDVGLEMSGNKSAFCDMLEAMNYGASIALLGIFAQPVAIDWSKVIFKGLTLKGIYGREMFETWYKMSTMLQSGLDVSGVITHRLPAASFDEAFRLMRAGLSGKILLSWE